MGTIADKTVYLDGTKDAIHDAIVAKGVSIDSGATFRSYATSIAAITTGCAVLPDLVAGGTYPKQDGTPVVISAISGETTAIRILVAATGPRKTALVLTFTGSPVIDWGDGTTTSPTNNVAAVHQYDGINPIPCSRPYGVYYITVTGGTVTAVASSSSRDDWGGAMGNIISVAFKSAYLQYFANIIVSSAFAITNYLVEKVYANCPFTTLNFFSGAGYHIAEMSLFSSSGTAVPFENLTSSPAATLLSSADLSHIKISGNFGGARVFANATSILFNPENVELGNVNIQYNSLSTAAFVALFESLPTVTSKTLQIGGSAAALALSAEQLAVATGKGWTVTRTY